MSLEPSSSSSFRFDGRLFRLIRKELSSILRDRRTILTLVLMPLLLYPLMVLAFQQFFLASDLNAKEERQFRIGATKQEDLKLIADLLVNGQKLKQSFQQRAKPDDNPAPPPKLVSGLFSNLEAALLDDQIDLGVMFHPEEGVERSPRFWNCEFFYLKGSQRSQEAARLVEQLSRYTNEFRILNSLNRATNGQTGHRVMHVLPRPVEVKGQSLFAVVSSLIPLVLILMTITGAVYPAIDLTAGERERGTLEILVAAPIPRMGLLFAKYITVLTVAILTAVINLTSMTISLGVSGLGRVIFTEGFSFLLVVQILFLLVLFAAFFSAVLLAVTSFARSFKEAQVYLIPLMLLSLSPGMISLLPGVELEGAMLIAPLLNIVLLASGILNGTATISAASVVILSTLLYALCAIGIAARIFGAEAVLYNEQGGWSDLFRRPKTPSDTPTLSGAMFCVALLLPLTFLFLNVGSTFSGMSMTGKLVIQALGNVVLMLSLPMLAIWWGRLKMRSTFRVEQSRWAAWLPAILLGISLWCFVSELIQLQRQWGIAGLPDSVLIRLKLQREFLRAVPLIVIILCLGIIPPVTEELFFRGYLFKALRATSSARSTILVSSVFFALFHLLTPVGLAIERFLPSMLMGIVLGWVAWRTGSCIPGILLHSAYNSSLLLLHRYEPTFVDWGWLTKDAETLPALWLLIAAGIAGIGLIGMYIIKHKAEPGASTPDQHSVN